MTRPRITVIAVVLLLPLVLGLSALGFTSYDIFIIQPDGSMTREAGWSFPNDNGDLAYGWVCAPVTGCQTLCGTCHTNREDRSKQVYTVEKHAKTYFPRAAVLYTSGQRLMSDPAGGYLSAGADGQLKYLRKDGTVELIAPRGSMLLKEPSGQTFGLWMPTVPTLRPR
jgi:hypothetical protein